MSTYFAPISRATRPHFHRGRYRFGNKKLADRLDQLRAAMHCTQSRVIHQIAKSGAEAVSYYRFMKNERVNMGELIAASTRVEAKLLAGRHVLAIGDSSSFSLKKRQQKIRDKERIGVLEDNKTPGFFSHVHFSPRQLSWAAWIIGRLGGWKGYQSQRPAGPITMKRGLEKVEIYFEAMKMLRSP